MDKLEYLIWRDCEKYKLQLDKTQNLSDEEIEKMVDKIEKAIEESDPLFFVGKEMVADETEVDYDLGFSGNYGGDYVVTKEDFDLWKEGETEDLKLFCGNVARVFRLREQWKINNVHERTKFRKLATQTFRILEKTPITNYSQIIRLFWKSEFFKDIDFTDLNSVKALFHKFNIYSYQEFFHQNHFSFKTTEFVLSDGQEVCYFGCDRFEDVCYDMNGEMYYLSDLDDK